MRPWRGILIAIEGIDGAGKTTQAECLRRALHDAGLEVVLSKEPTGGTWGRRLRESATSGRMSAEDELEAFLNDRAEHVRDLIQPALEAGKIVILDRYFYSTVAYQGARGLEFDELERRTRSQVPIPDVTILLDLDPQAAVGRISHGRGESPNLFERADYLGQVRAIFHRQAELHDEITLLDAQQPVEELRDAILRLVVDGPLHERSAL
ncbi:MAG: dTMP kinase [Pirellulaceae bacterium]|nr:dTMP kinase [Pirellulaceae bacterium]